MFQSKQILKAFVKFLARFSSFELMRFQNNKRFLIIVSQRRNLQNILSEFSSNRHKFERLRRISAKIFNSLPRTDLSVFDPDRSAEFEIQAKINKQIVKPVGT